MSKINVVIDEPGFRYVFQSFNGPSGKHFVRKCEMLENRARLEVGIYTGATLHSIGSYFYNRSGGDLTAHVGANPTGEEIGVAYFHHQGTRPHPIYPVRARYLRFPDRRTGQIQFRKRVFHPGTKPNPYLTDPLREII